MDPGASDSAEIAAGVFNPSSSNREELALDPTFINPSDEPVTRSCVSTACHTAGDAGASSSGSSSNFGGGGMHPEKKSVGSTGARGLIDFKTQLGTPRLYTLVPTDIVGERVLESQDVDLGFLQEFKDYNTDMIPELKAINVPEKDGWWTPPLHELEEVESLPDDLVKELDEHRHDYSQFMRILEVHGRCQTSSCIDKDFLLCFEDEKELHSSETSNASCEQSKAPQEEAEYHVPSTVKSTLSESFSHSWERGHFDRPSTEDLERCLDGIPVEADVEQWKFLFKSFNDDAVGEVSRLDWKKACEIYEYCLVLLEDIEESVGIHTQTWLLLWVCIPLAYLYQTKLRNYPKCVTVYDQVLQQLNRRIDTLYAQDFDGKWKLDMVVLYFTVIWHRRLVLFEWSYAFEKDGNQLLAQYARSKAVSKIRVRDNIYFVGFTRLEGIINYWGRSQRRDSGDMRAAFCFNLECLYGKSKQPEDAAEWTREKWRWIRNDIISRDLKIQWELEDVRSLFNAGLVDKARSIIGVLEAGLGKSEALPDIVSRRIDLWKAKFLMHSDPKAAGNKLTNLRKNLNEIVAKSKRGKATADEGNAANDLLTLVKFELSSLNCRGDAELLDHSPFCVELPVRNDEYWVSVDNTALDLLKEFRKSWEELKVPAESPSLDFAHGEQLLLSLAKRFPVTEIEEYRLRLDDAIKYITNCLLLFPQIEETLQSTDRVISHAELVFASQKISQCQAICFEFLGVCWVYYHQLKPRGEKYNVEDLAKELPVYDETCLDKAVEHFQKSLLLAETNGHADIRMRIFAKLGWVHFYKAKQLHHQAREFESLMRPLTHTFNEMSHTGYINKPEVEVWVEKGCGNPCHDHVYCLKLGLRRLDFYHVQGIATDPNISARVRMMWLTLGGYRPWFGIGGNILTCEDFEKTLRGCAGLLLRGLMVEIKRSTDYFKRSFELGYGRIQLDMSKSEQVKQQLVPLLSTVETTKKFFTILQHLMVFEVFVRRLIEYDEGLLRYVRCPETAEYLRGQPDDLTPSQKALLWAEGGRSRSLMCQLLANQLPDEPINDTSMTDHQDTWTILCATRRSCGENTVFVEYTFDSTHEFVSDVLENKRNLVNWIVYVVTKEDEVHMLSYQTESPEESLKDIHSNLSKGIEAKKVEKNLEELYNVFIDPIAGLLGTMEHDDKLVFALDEVLNNVPFAILRNSKTGKYLFETHTISFTPALRVLVHCDQRHISLQASQTVAPSVALGDPKGPKKLKHSLDEINSIKGPPFFNDGCVDILTGENATADNLLKLAELPADTVRGFIHVAAHCKAEEGHKSGSLELAYNSRDTKQTSGRNRISLASIKENSYLRSERIMQCGFEWRSHMVVLSACNSAKGYVLGSEGVVGIPRAFLLAGVPCIVASQWKLEDKSSSELMQEFYREMSQGGRDASSALRAAMLRKMKPDHDIGSSDHAQVDVYKWGGYLVWGSPTVTLPPSMIKID